MRKTTLNLDEDLFRKAKAAAARRGTTLTSFVEDALRQALARKPEEYALRWVTERGGTRPAVDPADRDALYDLMESAG